ncbi:hypothetical protein SAMN05444358_11012 [Ruegeria halocynthiae]|uniref:Uncharacterized protein n=1 Tax=Ruegeria halocynthiae TaxID=985054 RepID=A0A1H3E1C3_9RHOB|nr:hypothetical protein SAMN05444358_11012 [Ruegeria halocynthiae]
MLNRLQHSGHHYFDTIHEKLFAGNNSTMILKQYCNYPALFPVPHQYRFGNIPLMPGDTLPSRRQCMPSLVLQLFVVLWYRAGAIHVE